MTPARANEIEARDRALSEEWKRAVGAYVQAVNRAIETKADKYPDTVSADLTRRVFARVKALGREGRDQEAIRALFPFEGSAIQALTQKRQVRVFKTGLVGGRLWFCAGGYTERPKTWIADTRGLRRLDAPAGIRTIGTSKDGKTLAVLTQDMTVSLCEPDFTMRAPKTFRLPASITDGKGKTLSAFREPGDVDTLIPFDDGQSLLVSGHGGQVLIEGERLISLEQSGKEPRYDMTNIDLSRDQRRIAIGHQDSYHYVLDLDGKPLARVEPASSYPHCAIFNERIGQVAFNSCHFYNGTTLSLDDAAYHAEQPRSAGDAGVTELDDNDRVYAGVAYRDGYIWGHAYGYIRHVDGKGQRRWHQHVGGTITSIAINREETLLAVSTFAGLVMLIDLNSAGQNPYAIGSPGFAVPLRFVVTQDDAEPVRW